MDNSSPATKQDIEDLRQELKGELKRVIGILLNSARAQSARAHAVENSEDGLSARVAILEQQLLDLQIRRTQFELLNALQRTKPTRN